VSLCGPLFYYDLVRLARRGQTTLLRCAYGLVLLAMVCLAYANHFGEEHLLTFAPGHNVHHSALARFADQMVLTLLLLQASAVLVLTPVYVAGALGEEKERRTLDLLLTTHLRSHEIVLGKLFARLAHLTGLLLTAVPIFCLAMLWGGVDPTLLAASLAATGLTLLSTGGLTILCTVRARNMAGALTLVYGLVFVSGVTFLMLAGRSHVVLPVFFVLELRQQLVECGPAVDSTRIAISMVRDYALVHGLIFLVCTGWAIRDLRRIVRESAPAGSAQATASKPPPDTADRPRRPVGDHPLLWREMDYPDAVAQIMDGSPFPPIIVPILMLIFLVGWLALLVAGVAELGSLPRIINMLVRGVGTDLAALAGILIAFRAAASITGERARNTLDGLLCLPGERIQILQAKWLGSILRQRRVIYGLAFLWTVGLVSGTLHPLAILLMIVAGCVHAAFLASLGVWLSVVCRQTRRAYIVLGLVLFVMSAGLLWPVQRNTWLQGVLSVGINPYYTWLFLGFSWKECGEIMEDRDNPLTRPFYIFRGQTTLAFVLVGLLVLALAAWALWIAARRRFRKEFAEPRRGRPAVTGK
jgi:ABC-type transport system involved in multi-copper enzyme maturation permease subunit